MQTALCAISQVDGRLRGLISAVAGLLGLITPVAAFANAGKIPRPLKELAAAARVQAFYRNSKAHFRQDKLQKLFSEGLRHCSYGADGNALAALYYALDYAEAHHANAEEIASSLRTAASTADWNNPVVELLGHAQVMWVDGVSVRSGGAPFLPIWSTVLSEFASMWTHRGAPSSHEIQRHLDSVERLDSAALAAHRIAEAAGASSDASGGGIQVGVPVSGWTLRVVVNAVWESLAGREECQGLCTLYAPELARRLRAAGVDARLKATPYHVFIGVGDEVVDPTAYSLARLPQLRGSFVGDPSDIFDLVLSTPTAIRYPLLAIHGDPLSLLREWYTIDVQEVALAP